MSSGCIRLTNEDISDLYKRVKVGTRVVVLSGKERANVVTPSSQGVGSRARSNAPSATEVAAKKRQPPKELEQPTGSARDEASAAIPRPDVKPEHAGFEE